MIRRFSSYGPPNPNIHYYVPRETLVEQGCNQLLGEVFEEGGHYITVWAPRQRGKTFTMNKVSWRLQKNERIDVIKLELEHFKWEEDGLELLRFIEEEITTRLELPRVPINSLQDFYKVFHRGYLKKPLVLILDEFDALRPNVISGVVGAFRNIYNVRRNEPDKLTTEKSYLLHGVALIGVRAVLGIENKSGSPFNVQRSLHIANLTEAEVNQMFRAYEQDSGQTVEQAVIDQVFYETRGQPGLVSWLGELLTETYPVPTTEPITADHFKTVYGRALNVLPNNNILNIISKARQMPYRNTVLELFRTQAKIPFRYEDQALNFLYLNGVIDWIEEAQDKFYVKFPCPFVQKRLFHYFAGEIAYTTDRLYDPFDDLSDTFTETTLNVPALLRRCEVFFRDNREWLLKDAPRRKTDLRLYEAVYHFNLYTYIRDVIRRRDGHVLPEFPTGNGKVDLIIRYAGQIYAIEVKSFSDAYGYRRALKQAARYGQELGLPEITLALFVEAVNDANRAKFEAVYEDADNGVTVRPIFIETGA